MSVALRSSWLPSRSVLLGGGSGLCVDDGCWCGAGVSLNSFIASIAPGASLRSPCGVRGGKKHTKGALAVMMMCELWGGAALAFGHRRRQHMIVCAGSSFFLVLVFGVMRACVWTRFLSPLSWLVGSLAPSWVRDPRDSLKSSLKSSGGHRGKQTTRHDATPIDRHTSIISKYILWGRGGERPSALGVGEAIFVTLVDNNKRADLGLLVVCRL